MKLAKYAVAIAAVALALLVAGPAGSVAAASGGPTAHLKATNLEVAGGTFLDSALVGLTVAGGSAPEHLPTRPFSIEAEAIRVHTENRSTNLQVLAQDLPQFGSGQVQFAGAQERIDWGLQGTRAASESIRIGHELFLVALDPKSAPTVRFTTIGGALSVPTEETIEEDGGLPPKGEPLSASLAGALEWGGSRTGEMIIEGDFAIMLWDTDVRVSGEAGENLFRSGTDRQQVLAVPDGVAEGDIRVLDRDVHVRQIYLYVEGGILRTPWFHQETTRLYIRDTDNLEVNGAMVLHGVSGEIPSDRGVRNVTSNEVTLSGSRLVAVPEAQANGYISLMLRGDIDDTRTAEHGEIQGAFRAPAKESSLSRWLGVPLFAATLAVGAPAAATGGMALRRRWLSHTMAELEADMELEEYDAVVHRAGPLLRSKRHAADAAVMKAVSLIRLGDLPAAREFLDSIRKWTGPEATRDYLYAYLYALEGDWNASAARLADCLQAAPDFYSEVVSNPAFARVLEDDSFKKQFFPSPEVGALEGYN